MMMAKPTNALAPQTPVVNSLLDKVNPMAIYRRNVDAPKRVYGEALMKSFSGRTKVPITETDFTPQELGVLSQLVNESYQKKLAYFGRPKDELLSEASQFEKDAAHMAILEKNDPDIKGTIGLTSKGLAAQARLLKDAAAGKTPQDFSFGYEDYTNAKTPTNDVNWVDTLGRFRYKVDPATSIFQVYDTYDFANMAHQKANQEYASMSPTQRFKSALSNFFKGDQSALGEAYLGTNQGVPMNIKIGK
jgi:hypothetical protein